MCYNALMKALSQAHTHPFPPVYDARSRVLVLGTFPSVKSRETGFYYGHPQNRFWRVAAGVFGEPPPDTIEAKRAFLLAHGVALWDVLASCEITGSADASIKHAEANDIGSFLRETGVARVLANGSAAYSLYMKHVYPKTGVMPLALPSTSPANASYSLERLIGAWRAALLAEDGA